jgi:cytochrome c oxidase subunit 2
VIVDEPDDYQNWYAAQQSFSQKNPEVLAALKQKPKSLVSEPAEPVEGKEVAPAPLAASY